MKKKIFILVNKYPNDSDRNVCVFIQQLVWEFADLGYICIVINPIPINLNKTYLLFPKSKIEKTENNSKVTIFYPKYISLGQSGKLLQKLRVKFTTWQYKMACDRILSKQTLDPNNDVIYSHFICPSGVTAALLGRKYKIKSFMAHGEATFSGDEKYGNKYLSQNFVNLTGVIAVSTQNKNYLINADVVDAYKIKIFPNGYRKERFYKIDKLEARKHFGWDNKKFIVGFCGSFDDRKGILRLEKAVDIINNKDIVFVCAGKGKLNPTSKKCIFSKPVNNDELNYFYNAIDIFCLPTQNEGCCNAIVEAMACGCPIISSNKDFNYDILDKKNAILINPDNIEEIKNAILELYNNEKTREKMAQESLVKSKDLTLENRAKKIVRFLFAKM